MAYTSVKQIVDKYGEKGLVEMVNKFEAAKANRKSAAAQRSEDWAKFKELKAAGKL